jgi:magnesium chelatase family protein
VIAVARTFTLIGIYAQPVHVELDVTRGLPAFTIVGLPDAAVRESRERVRAALLNSGFTFPLQRITANLAPADLRKAGPGFDLAIAAALMVASKQVERGVLERYALAGELALDGSIRPVPGALAMAEGARARGLRGIAVAPEDAPQAALVDGLEVVALEHVSRLPALAGGELDPVPAGGLRLVAAPDAVEGPDLADLRGQPGLRRALEIAAAGGHSMLIIGPPGAGKTLAARRLPSLLPPLAPSEALEVIRIAGATGSGVGGGPAARPFRSPHHTASPRALLGGGTPPHPGEVTRAHRGVLFLDELGEFRRDALESLRQPLEQNEVTVSRVGYSISLPCRFMLVAASNPCPCGHGSDSGECQCHPSAAARYRAKLSGALADRIEIQVSVERPRAEDMAAEPGESSSAVRERVAAARERQAHRLGEGRCNADMAPEDLRRHAGLGAEAEALLAKGHRDLGLSGRGWDRVLRVARTIADLSGAESVGTDQIAGALELRRRVEL